MRFTSFAKMYTILLGKTVNQGSEKKIEYTIV